MRERYSIMAVLLIWASTGTNAFGQMVTKVPNNFGLDVESVTIDSAASTARIAVHNTSGKPITAYVVSLAPIYSDGEELVGERLIDFFCSVGLARIIPQGPGTDPDHLDSITSGASRHSTFVYDSPRAIDARLTAIRVRVTGLIFEDESTAGDSKFIGEIFQVRDAESSEVLRWCADVKQFSGAAVSKKTVDGMLARHSPQPKPEGRAIPGEGATEATRSELLRTFQWGIRWQSEGTATLDERISEVFEVRCTNAEEHLKRKGLR